MSDENDGAADEALEAAMDELTAEDTRTWLVVAGKADDSITSHIWPGFADVDGVEIGPPYGSFIGYLIFKAAAERGIPVEQIVNMALSSAQADAQKRRERREGGGDGA